MEEIKELYVAYMRFSRTGEEIVFNYSAMEIIKCYPNVIETKYSHFTNKNNSTRYFEKSMLDREYDITDELTVFYSADKGKCINWLTEKRNSYIWACRKALQNLEQSKIQEVIEKI